MALTAKEQLDRFIAPLRRAVSGMLAKALLDSVVDSTDLQTMKVVVDSEEHSDVERVQNYGFTSRPGKGAQTVVVFIGGRRDNPLVIACDDGRERVKVNDGEVAVYSKFGSKIVLKDDGSVEVTPASGKSFKVNGKIEATLDIAAGLDIVAGPAGATVSLLKHMHPTAALGPPSPPTPTP